MEDMSQRARRGTGGGSRSPATGEIPRRRPAQTATSNVPSKARVTSSDPSDRGPELRCRNHGLRRGRESHGTYQGLNGPRCQSADFPAKETPGQRGWLVPNGRGVNEGTGAHVLWPTDLARLLRVERLLRKPGNSVAKAVSKDENLKVETAF